MGKGLIIGIIVAILIVIGLLIGLTFDRNEASSSEEGRRTDESIRVIAATPTPSPSQSNFHTILITSSGFSPNILEIKQGDSVIFVNELYTQHWPASDIHPTHTVYPGSNINKCGTAEEPNIFDSCKGLNEGESYTFIFDEIGSWNYHDHLRASSKGKIIVS